MALVSNRQEAASFASPHVRHASVRPDQGHSLCAKGARAQIDNEYHGVRGLQLLGGAIQEVDAREVNPTRAFDLNFIIGAKAPEGSGE